MASNSWPWSIVEDKWSTDNDGFRGVISEFAVDADIVSSISSDGNQTRNFVSAPNVDFNTPNPVIGREWHLTSTANIVFDTPSVGYQLERQFTSSINLVFSTSSDIDSTFRFKSQPSIGFVVGSTIFARKEFQSQADIVFAEGGTATIYQGGLFAVTAGIATSARSDIKKTDQFQSQADIVFAEGGTATIREENRFTSTANIVWDAKSAFAGYRSFAVAPTITWNTISDINRLIRIATTANIVSATTAKVQTTRNFGVTPTISWGATAKVNATREFKPEKIGADDVVFDIQRPALFKECQFKSVPPNNPQLEFSITVKPNARRELKTTAAVALNFASAGGNAQRVFASTPTVSVAVTGKGNATRELKSQADIIWSLTGSFQRKREFAVTSNVVFDIPRPRTSRYLGFVVAPSIQTATNNVNIYSTNYFKSSSGISFSIIPKFYVERRFTVNPTTTIIISTKTSIFSERMLASTVNMIINVKSLNIWNQSIDDLFPCTVRSLTPKRTAKLI
jgi:hypothetical protein